MSWWRTSASWRWPTGVGASDRFRRGGAAYRCHRPARGARRGRRAHPHGDALWRHQLGRHLRDGHAGRSLGRHYDDRRLRHPAKRRAAARRARRLARQSRGELRHRLRLPHDRFRRKRAVLQRDGRACRRGDHELQAVHGLSRSVLLNRRRHPAGHATSASERRHRNDARRERHRN